MGDLKSHSLVEKGALQGEVALPRTPQAFLETARSLVKLFEAGLNNRHAIGGWHGTSLEAIERTLLQGTLPGSAVAHGDAVAGHLFFFPPHPRDFQPGIDLRLQKFGRGGAMRYAETNAQTAYAMRELRLDFHDGRLQSSVRDLINHTSGLDLHADKAYAHVQTYVPERRHIDACVRESSARKGVLIALSADALKSAKVTDGDVAGEDLKIFAPQGLSLSIIAGLEPLGDAEMRYFETLQTLVEALSRNEASSAPKG